MSEDKKPKKSKITPEVQDLAVRISEHLLFLEGKISDKPDETAYAATLPANLTMQQIADMEAHNRQFVQASNLAIGQMANDAIAKDEKLQSVTGCIAFGASNKLNTITDRLYSQKIPNPDGSTTTKEIKGNTVVSVHITGVERSEPVIREIRDKLRKEADGKW